MFAHRTAVKQSSVKDGLSNTVLFSEALVGTDTVGTKWRDSVTNISDPGASLLNPIISVNAQMQLAPTVLSALQLCNTAFQGTSNHTYNRGWRWGAGSPGLTMFNTVVTPNSNNYVWSGCRFGCPGCGIDFGNFINASSGHPGGVNCAFADGSVHFIKNTIAQNVWWSIGTRAGGEVVSSNSYQ